MRLISLPALMLFFLTGFGQAPARHSFTSLEDLWQYADAQNIRLLSAQTDLLVSRAATQQAKQNLLPTITANGSFTDNVKIQPTLVPAKLFNAAAPADAYLEAKFGRRYIYNSSVVAQMNLLNTQDWFSIKAAAYNNEIAALNLVKTRKEVYEQIANLYYSYLLLQEAVGLAAVNQLSADSIMMTAKHKMEEGQVSEVTLNTAMINQEKALSNYQSVQQQLSTSLNSLKILLNLSKQDSLLLTEKLVPSALKTPSLAADSNPDKDIAFNQWQLAKTKYHAARYAYLPTLALVYQWNATVAGDQFIKFNSSNTLQQQYYGLRFSLPIVAGGTRKFQVKQSQWALDLHKMQYESISKQADLDYENLLLAYESARQTYTSNNHILLLYGKNDAHARNQFSEGLISLDKRITYYTDYINSQQQYLQALSDYLIQYYRIQIRQKALLP